MKKLLRKTPVYLALSVMCLASTLFAAPTPPSSPQASVAEVIRTVLDPKTSGAELEALIARLKVEAEAGDAEALSALGFCYANGKGVPADEAIARSYFEKASEKGSVTASGNLGLFLIRGRGGDQDLDRGVTLMTTAAEGGNLQARLLLGEVFYFGLHQTDAKPDYQKAYAHLIVAAEAGNPSAQNMIGVIFKDGLAGTIDLDAARIWLEKAALGGEGKACFNLAEIWNPNSENRLARIESLRWLIVGDKLGEVTATRLLEDLRKSAPADEMAVATELAQSTLQYSRRS